MERSDFGELRGMLEQEPSVAGFENLIYFMEFHGSKGVSEQIRSEWLPYALARLEQSWPDATRECPKALLERYESGEALWCPMVRSLNFEGEGLAKKRTNRILAAKHMQGVTRLDLRSTRIKWEQLNEIAEAAPFGEIKHLAFRKSTRTVEYEALGDFFASRMVSRVESLSFRGWGRIQSDVYTLLVKRFPLENLKVLDLSGPRIISPKRLKELLDTGRLEQLEELYFRSDGSYSDYAGILEVLIEHGGLKKLRVLHVEGAQTKDLIALAQAACFESLEALILYRAQWDVGSLDAFVSSPYFPRLRHFVMECREEGLERVEAACAANFFERLETLVVDVLSMGIKELEGARASLQAVDTLLESGQLRGVKRFALSYPYFWSRSPLPEDEQRAFLARQLERLGTMEFEGLEALCYSADFRCGEVSLPEVFLRAGYLERLEELQVMGDVFKAGVLDALTDAPVDLRVKRLGLGFGFPVKEFERFVASEKFSFVEQLRVSEHVHEDCRKMLSCLADSDNASGLRQLIFKDQSAFHGAFCAPRYWEASRWTVVHGAASESMISPPLWIDGEGA